MFTGVCRGEASASTATVLLRRSSASPRKPQRKSSPVTCLLEVSWFLVRGAPSETSARS
jgi:hypothetical protein